MKARFRYVRWFAFFVAVSLAGCSTYFNTFYNAETAFDDGYKIHEKVMDAYPDSLVPAPPPEAKTKYDRAIEKSIKVLDVFPRDKKWHDNAVFLLGKSYYYEKETGKAIRWLRRLQEEYQQSPFIPESYLYLARAYVVDDNLARAEETLKFALNRYPFLDKDFNLSLLLVEIELRREGKLKAIGLLENVRGSARGGTLQADLLLRSADLFRSMGQYDKAVALLKKAPRDKRDPLQSYRIDHNLVTCYVELDSLKTAAAILAGMRTNRAYGAYRKEILFANGLLFVRQGKTDEAIAAYKQVIGSTDTNVIKADTAKIISRAWFELGKLYQKQKTDLKEALKYYRLVSERTVVDSQATPLALVRFKAIQAIADLRKRIAAGDTALDRSAGLYTISEHFLFDLDEPDSACREYSRLAGDTTVDSASVQRALFAFAQVKRVTLRDTTASDSLFKLVVNRFPLTDYARRARKELGLAAQAKTPAEEAADAFSEAERIYFSDRDCKAAVQAYYTIYKKYPDLAIAQRSLYAAAWISDNELQKKKVAKSLYEKICERYPKSDYCTNQAKPRIKVVLDTIEALRRLKKPDAFLRDDVPAGKNTMQSTPPDSGNTMSEGKTDSTAVRAADSSGVLPTPDTLLDRLPVRGTGIQPDSAAPAIVPPPDKAPDSGTIK